MRYSIFGTLFPAILALVSLPAPALAAPQGGACDTLPVLPLDATLHVGGAAAGEALFALDVPAPGFLAVELNVPAFAAGIAAWVDVSPAPCSSRDGAREHLRVLDRSPERQILAILTPGTYALSVGTVVLSERLSGYKLSTRFLDPSSFSAVPGEACALPPVLTKDGNAEDDTEESDNEILPFRIGPSCAAEGFASLAGGDADGGVASFPWCEGAAENADDLRLCARPLRWNEALTAELRDVWGDDHDYYTFEVDRARVVHLLTTGTTDTFGSLYDASGRLLLTADDGGEGESFAFAAALAPGRYLVRVEGAPGAAGAYGLGLWKSSWPAPR